MVKKLSNESFIFSKHKSIRIFLLQVLFVGSNIFPSAQTGCVFSPSASWWRRFFLFPSKFSQVETRSLCQHAEVVYAVGLARAASLWGFVCSTIGKASFCYFPTSKSSLPLRVPGIYLNAMRPKSLLLLWAGAAERSGNFVIAIWRTCQAEEHEK